jgi:hypothetical protein
MHADMGAVRSHCLDALDVRFGYLLRFVVGVAHLIAAELAFAADFTCSCHESPPRTIEIMMVETGAYNIIITEGLQGEKFGPRPAGELILDISRSVM